MSIHLHRSADQLCADFQGILSFHDHAEGERLLADLDQALETAPAREIRFDLAGVEALDSHWLGVFVRALRRARAAGAEFVLARPGPHLQRLFAAVELDRAVTIRA